MPEFPIDLADDRMRRLGEGMALMMFEYAKANGMHGAAAISISSIATAVLISCTVSAEAKRSAVYDEMVDSVCTCIKTNADAYRADDLSKH